MFRRLCIRLTTGTAVVAGVVVVLHAHSPPAVAGQGRTESCSAKAYGRALAIDESTLSSHSVNVAGRSAEGSELTVLRHRSRPRLLRAIDFGETGRAITSIYLVDSLTFVVWRTEHRYSGAIAEHPQPRIMSTVTSVAHFCNGTPLGTANIDLSDALDLVRAAYRGRQ